MKIDRFAIIWFMNYIICYQNDYLFMYSLRPFWNELKCFEANMGKFEHLVQFGDLTNLMQKSVTDWQTYKQMMLDP